jgi:hypothetical protein
VGSGIKLAAAAIVEVSCGGTVASGASVAAGLHPTRVATMTNVIAKRFLWVMIPPWIIWMRDAGGRWLPRLHNEASRLSRE